MTRKTRQRMRGDEVGGWYLLFELGRGGLSLIS